MPVYLIFSPKYKDIEFKKKIQNKITHFWPCKFENSDKTVKIQDGALIPEVGDQTQNYFGRDKNLLVSVPSFVKIGRPCLWTPIIGHCMVFSETGC